MLTNKRNKLLLLLILTQITSFLKCSLLNAQCTANITTNISPAQGCDPFTLQLFDQSTGFVVNRTWLFGDGTPNSSAQNPIHTFVGQGRDTSYTVTLKAYCLNGDSSFANLMVTVFAIPQVEFVADTTQFCALSDTICFTNLSSQGSGYSYLWNFGDNTSSSLLQPCKIYSLNGNYTVSLTVVNNQGCQNSATKTNYLNARRAPNPDFTISNFMGCAPFNVGITNTTNTTTDTIAGWLWNFGDGSPFSNVKDPLSHTYTNEGTYIISLQATNNLGCSNTTTRPLIVKPTPQAAFSIPSSACVNQPVTVTFTGQVTGSANYTWDFGGGNVLTGSGQGPYTVNYGSSGIPLIQLTVEQNGCSTSVANSLQINPLPSGFLFNNVNDTACQGDNITFTIQPSGYTNYEFSINSTPVQSGASNIYQAQNVTGTFTVSAQITDFNGCVNTLTSANPIFVKPKPGIQLIASNDTLCQGDTAVFYITPGNLNSYNFYSGFIPIQSGPSDTLVVPDIQSTITINAEGILNGCVSKLDTAFTAVVIKKLDAPIVNCGTSTDTSVSFFWDPINLADGYNVSINGMAYGLPSSGLTGLNHVIYGLNPGDSVSINVLPIGYGTCGNGFASSTKVCYARPCDLNNFDLTTNSISVCEGTTITVSVGNFTVNNFSISWQNGVYGSNQNQNFTITNDTNITVSVRNNSQLSCPVTTKSISINAVLTPPVTLSASTDTLCSGNSVTVNAYPLTYSNYTFLNGFSIIQSSPNPQTNFIPNNGLNPIRVIGTTAGCSDTSDIIVPVFVKTPLPAPQLNCGTTSLNSIEFVWTSVSGANGYEISLNGGPFITPSTGINGTEHSITGLNPNDAVTAIVKAIGEQPCGDSYYSISTTCYAKPCTAVNFTTNTQYTVCENTNLNLSVSNISIPNYQISWNGGQFGTSNTYNYNATSNVTIPVSVKNLNELACPVATQYITINVVPTPFVTLNVSPDSVCAGSSLTFSALPTNYPNYIFVSGFSVLQSGPNPQYISGSIINGENIKVVADNQGCRDTSNVITAVVRQPLAIPQPNCGTSTLNSITFFWDTIPNANGYQISINGGAFTNPTSGLNGTTHFISGLNANDSISIIVQALGPPPCGNSVLSNSITCYARNCTGINFNLNAPANACEGEIINASVTNITSPNYEVSWQSLGYGNSTGYTFTASQNVTLSVSVRNPNEIGCPAVTKLQNITVQPKVNVTLTPNSTNSNICQGTLFSVSANPTYYQNYAFILNGNTIQNNADPNFTNIALVPGANQIVVIPTQNGCAGNPDTVEVNYFLNPVLSLNSSINQDSVCEGSTVNLTVSPVGLTNYNFFYNGNLIQSNTNPIFVFTPVNIGNNNIVIVNATNAGGCSSTNDTITYTVVANPTITLNASAQDSICPGQNITLSVSPAGLNNYNFILNGNSVQNNSSNVYSSSNFQNLDSIRAIATNSFGCISNMSNTIGFILKPTYKPTININDSTAICLGSSISLTASVNPAVSGLSYSWNTGQTTSSINVSPSSNTLYLAYSIFRGCKSEPDSVLIKVDNQPSPVADAGLGSTICRGDSVQLSGSGGLNYLWYNSSNELIGNMQSIFVSPKKDETFTVVVTNLACSSTDTIRITVDRCLKDITGPIPQIISPNDDGANDFWIVPDVDYFKNNNVTIFNRWGNVVYEASPYLNNWHGQNQKNGDLPDGTYYYILNLNNDENKVYNGFVIIHR